MRTLVGWLISRENNQPANDYRARAIGGGARSKGDVLLAVATAMGAGGDRCSTLIASSFASSKGVDEGHRSSRPMDRAGVMAPPPRAERTSNTVERVTK